MPLPIKPTITLEQFEGPYDLLLELVHQEKLDVSLISLTAVTESFLGMIEREEISPELLADFLVVAATLLLLKLRRVLPDIQPEEAEEIELLAGRVQVYELYRRQAEEMRNRWGRKLFSAGFWGPTELQREPMYGSITTQALASALTAMLDALPAPAAPTAHLTVKGRTLKETLALFEERFKTVKNMVFHEQMKGESTHDVAVALLALLEMARNQAVELHQDKEFANIRIEKKRESYE